MSRPPLHPNRQRRQPAGTGGDAGGGEAGQHGLAVGPQRIDPEVKGRGTGENGEFGQKATAERPPQPGLGPLGALRAHRLRHLGMIQGMAIKGAGQPALLGRERRRPVAAAVEQPLHRFRPPPLGENGVGDHPRAHALGPVEADGLHPATRQPPAEPGVTTKHRIGRLGDGAAILGADVPASAEEGTRHGVGRAGRGGDLGQQLNRRRHAGSRGHDRSGSGDGDATIAAGDAVVRGWIGETAPAPTMAAHGPKPACAVTGDRQPVSEGRVQLGMGNRRHHRMLMHRGRPGPAALVANGITVIEGRKAAAALGADDVARKLLAAFSAHCVPPRDSVHFRKRETESGRDGDNGSNHQTNALARENTDIHAFFIVLTSARTHLEVDKPQERCGKKPTSSVHAMAGWRSPATGIVLVIHDICGHRGTERFCRRASPSGNSVSMSQGGVDR